MRILHFSDVHLDRPFVGLPLASRKRRRDAIWEGFVRCLAAASDEAVDLVTVGGDLWEDENVSENTRQAVAYELGKLDCPVLIVCGNHDPRLPGGNYDQTCWPENVHIFRAGALEERRFDGLSVWGSSWGGGTLSASFLDSFRAPVDGQAHVLLLHGTAGGAGFPHEAGGYCSFDPARIENAGVALCLAAHSHRAEATDTVIYPGSPEPLGWGEDGDHCYALVAVHDGGAELERLVAVNRTRYERRTVVCEGAASDAEVRDVLEEALAAKIDTENLYLQIELTGEIGRGCLIDTSALALPYAESYGALVIRDQTRPAVDYLDLAKRSTADGLFARNLLAKIEVEADVDRRRCLEQALRIGVRSLENVAPLLSVRLPADAD